MRKITLLPLILFATCAAAPLAGAQPMVRVDYGGLALGTPEDRATLHARVDEAARDFCRAHADEVTPQLLRRDLTYCPKRVRTALMADMPRDIRAAYRLALREAGIRLSAF